MVTINIERAFADRIEDLSKKLSMGASVADELARPIHESWMQQVRMQAGKDKLDGTLAKRLKQSEETIASWEKGSGKPSIYTPARLADAQLANSLARSYEATHQAALLTIDGLHQIVVMRAIKASGFDKTLIAEGKVGRLFALVELSARLSPALTFPGSSDYFVESLVPYGRQARVAAGERAPAGNYVNSAVALESAQALVRTLGVHYALAETSAAPREDVPKSGKKPIIHIAGLSGSAQIVDTAIEIDTPFRSIYNAKAREEMYRALRALYKGVTP